MRTIICHSDQEKGVDKNKNRKKKERKCIPRRRKTIALLIDCINNPWRVSHQPLKCFSFFFSHSLIPDANSNANRRQSREPHRTATPKRRTEDATREARRRIFHPSPIKMEKGHCSCIGGASARPARVQHASPASSPAMNCQGRRARRGGRCDFTGRTGPEAKLKSHDFDLSRVVIEKRG